MKRKSILALLIVTCLTLALVACTPEATPTPTQPAPTATQPAPTTPPPTPAEVIELKTLTFLPPFIGVAKEFITLIDRINAQTEGELVLKFVGGPEAIPAFEQPEALRTGVIDVLCTPASFYRNLLPEAVVYQLSMLTPIEERETGFYDFELERHKQINMYVLGRTRIYEPMYTMLKKPVEKPADLAGLKIARSSPLSQPFYKALGCTVVTVQNSEYYSSLERGVTDGVGYPLAGAIDLSLSEVTDYFINHPFLIRPSVLFLMNLDKWNSIPPHLQKVLMDMTIEWENEKLANDEAYYEDIMAQVLAAGMEPIEFAPDDAKYYTDLAYSTEWDLIEEAVPDIYPELKKLLKQ